MLRQLSVLALVLVLWGCGGEDEVEELKMYVKSIQQFYDHNMQIEKYIAQFDDPSIPVTEAEVHAARKLVDDSAAAVRALEEPDESALKNTHRLYARCFDDARRLAQDLTGDLRRQAHSVAIGMRNLRRDIRDRVYPSIEVLLDRKKISHVKGSEYAMPWPAE